LKFAFVGPEDVDFAASKLHQLAKVYFCGKQDLSTRPKPRLISRKHPKELEPFVSFHFPILGGFNHPAIGRIITGIPISFYYKQQDPLI
jgi:hypothetical protein